MHLEWLGTELLTWADLRAICTKTSFESALGAELAGFPPGVRLSHVIQAQQVNEIRMLAYGLGGGKGPKPQLIDLIKQNEPAGIKFKHKPDKLTVEEFNRRVGWD
jgi:hypothetical protein